MTSITATRPGSQPRLFPQPPAAALRRLSSLAVVAIVVVLTVLAAPIGSRLMLASPAPVPAMTPFGGDVSVKIAHHSAIERDIEAGSPGSKLQRVRCAGDAASTSTCYVAAP